MFIRFLYFFLLLQIPLALHAEASGPFQRSSYLRSYLDLIYRFYRNDPLSYRLSARVNIPFLPAPSYDITGEKIPLHRTLSSFGYTFISGSIPQHSYSLRQSWYGDFLHAEGGYALTHRVDPSAVYRHELPLNLGAYFANWEIKFLSTLSWEPFDFHSKFGGGIAYLFYTEKRRGPFDSGNLILNRAEILVYQTSANQFTIRNSYQFSLTDSPLTRLYLSWEVFPIRIGVAFQFGWKNQFQAVTHTQYNPEWGFDESVEVGILNYFFGHYGMESYNRKVGNPNPFEEMEGDVKLPINNSVDTDNPLPVISSSQGKAIGN